MPSRDPGVVQTQVQPQQEGTASPVSLSPVACRSSGSVVVGALPAAWHRGLEWPTALLEGLPRPRLDIPAPGMSYMNCDLWAMSADGIVGPVRHTLDASGSSRHRGHSLSCSSRRAGRSLAAPSAQTGWRAGTPPARVLTRGSWWRRFRSSCRPSNVAPKWRPALSPRSW
jgi:hypothetical protein